MEARTGVVLGSRIGPFDTTVSRDFARRYTAAIDDPSPAARAGDVVLPTALVTLIWDAQNEGRTALVPEALQASATGGVHGEHDLVVHRGIRPGEPLRTFVEGHGARPAGRNCAVTLRYSTYDAGDALVAEQWWTTMFLGTTCEPMGDPAPEHAFPDDARARPIGTYAVEVDTGMAHRYAEVSGDWSPHHFEVDAARASGVDRVFLHGLCTMALCAQGVVALVSDGAPERLRRVALRFASPTFLGETLTLHCYDAGALGVAFEAECAGARVVAHGRAEVR